MLRGLFITGTGTGVGKTVVAAAMMHRLRSNFSVRYWKPVETGIESSDETAEVRRLGLCTDAELLLEGIRLPGPVSPHLAAELSEVEIRIPELMRCVEGRIDSHDPATRWIVEGAGGALVPLNESELMVDFMAQLRLPVIVVARSELGTINHTLLTLEALRSRSLHVAGVVMVGVRNTSNRHAIEHFGDVAVVGEMPPIPDLTADKLRLWAVSEMDPSGILLKVLQ